MEASGASAKLIRRLDGLRSEVISSGNVVQIDDLSFDRLQLLFAMGVNSGDLEQLQNGRQH